MALACCGNVHLRAIKRQGGQPQIWAHCDAVRKTVLRTKWRKPRSRAPRPPVRHQATLEVAG